MVFGGPDLYLSEVSVWSLIMLKPNTRASHRLAALSLYCNELQITLLVVNNPTAVPAILLKDLPTRKHNLKEGSIHPSYTLSEWLESCMPWQMQ